MLVPRSCSINAGSNLPCHASVIHSEYLQRDGTHYQFAMPAWTVVKHWMTWCPGPIAINDTSTVAAIMRMLLAVLLYATACCCLLPH
jgi:hypothetical protein